MSKFKAGDKVRCIEAYRDEVGQIDMGGIYTVASVETYVTSPENGPLLRFKESNIGAYSRRFELVTPDFKPGDRVAVAFEGVITSTYEGTAYFGNGPKTYGAPLSSLAKLNDPIPTTAGAVIRIDKTGTIYQHAGNGSWFIPGNEIEYRTGPQAEADDYGFTVLYAGDES